MNRAGRLLTASLIALGWASGAAAQEAATLKSSRSEATPAHGSKSAKLPLPIALDDLPAHTRESVCKVMYSPTLKAVAPADEFAASTETYMWLLDHPDRVCLAWQRLKVAAIDIKETKNGKFAWKDDQGSELNWHAVAQNGDGRIWYAEGKVRPGRLLPLVPVKAVAVLRHGQTKDEDGEPLIRHQVEVFLQTDSRTAALIMRLIGPAAPRLAEEGAEQLLMFFSGIARYVDRHPTKAKDLLAEKK